MHASQIIVACIGRANICMRSGASEVSVDGPQAPSQLVLLYAVPFAGPVLTHCVCTHLYVAPGKARPSRAPETAPIVPVLRAVIAVFR